jgi:hypothetical protein
VAWGTYHYEPVQRRPLAVESVNLTSFYSFLMAVVYWTRFVRSMFRFRWNFPAQSLDVDLISPSPKRRMITSFIVPTNNEILQAVRFLKPQSNQAEEITWQFHPTVKFFIWKSCPGLGVLVSTKRLIRMSNKIIDDGRYGYLRWLVAFEQLTKHNKEDIDLRSQLWQKFSLV